MNYTRQLDILGPGDIIFPVTIIGCGGIGCITAVSLAKLGCPDITLMDDDMVEDHNLPNQFFRICDLGKPKVIACKEIIKDFSPDCQVTAITEKFDGSQSLSGIIISGLDTMSARKMVWEKVKYNIDVPLYIDGRLGGEIMQVFTVRPCQIEDVEFYEDEENLFPDEEAVQLPCTARAIMYTGFGIACLIGSQMKKWLRGEVYHRRISSDLKTMIKLLIE